MISCLPSNMMFPHNGKSSEPNDDEDIIKLLSRASALPDPIEESEDPLSHSMFSTAMRVANLTSQDSELLEHEDVWPARRIGMSNLTRSLQQQQRQQEQYHQQQLQLRQQFQLSGSTNTFQQEELMSFYDQMNTYKGDIKNSLLSSNDDALLGFANGSACSYDRTMGVNDANFVYQNQSLFGQSDRHDSLAEMTLLESISATAPMQSLQPLWRSSNQFPRQANDVNHLHGDMFDTRGVEVPQNLLPQQLHQQQMLEQRTRHTLLDQLQHHHQQDDFHRLQQILEKEQVQRTALGYARNHVDDGRHQSSSESFSVASASIVPENMMSLSSMSWDYHHDEREKLSERMNSESIETDSLASSASSHPSSSFQRAMPTTTKMSLKRSASRKKRAISFPEKFMKAIIEHTSSTTEASDSIAWLPDSKSFVIVNPENFVNNIVNKVFKQAKYSSFIRKLHRWGFIRVSSGSGKDCFQHPFFNCERPELAAQITCLATGQPGTIGKSNADASGQQQKAGTIEAPASDSNMKHNSTVVGRFFTEEHRRTIDQRSHSSLFEENIANVRNKVGALFCKERNDPSAGMMQQRIRTARLTLGSNNHNNSEYSNDFLFGRRIDPHSSIIIDDDSGTKIQKDFPLLNAHSKPKTMPDVVDLKQDNLVYHTFKHT